MNSEKCGTLSQNNPHHPPGGVAPGERIDMKKVQDNNS